MERSKINIRQKSGELKEMVEAITKGMKNVFSKGKVKCSCKGCGLAIPVYGGRYPGKCPDCGGELG